MIASIAVATGIPPRELLAEPEVLEAIVDVLGEAAAERRTDELQDRLRKAVGR